MTCIKLDILFFLFTGMMRIYQGQQMLKKGCGLAPRVVGRSLVNGLLGRFTSVKGNDLFQNFQERQCIVSYQYRQLKTSALLLRKLPDHYSQLGVSKHASKKDIKKAWLKMCQTYHPDKNASSEAKQKFTKIQEAYKVLGNSLERKRYDEEMAHRGHHRSHVRHSNPKQRMQEFMKRGYDHIKTEAEAREDFDWEEYKNLHKSTQDEKPTEPEGPIRSVYGFGIFILCIAFLVITLFARTRDAEPLRRLLREINSSKTLTFAEKDTLRRMIRGQYIDTYYEINASPEFKSMVLKYKYLEENDEYLYPDHAGKGHKN